MRKIILASMAAAAFSLAACSEKAQQETSEAGDAIAADAASDAGNAVEGTVNAAGDAAAAAGDKIQEETKKAEANDK